MRITRRRFLAGSAAAVAVGGTGTAWWSTRDSQRAAWIEDVVRRNLPGVALDEPSLQIFVRTTLASELFASRKRRLAFAAHQSVPWLVARMPRARERIALLERMVLTEYLLGSNFFRSDPRHEVIVFHGRAVACANPFASLA